MKSTLAAQELRQWWQSGGTAEIERCFALHWEAMARSFHRCLQNLRTEYGRMEQSARKEPLRYVAIAYLHSGLCCEKNTHRIDLFDHNYFVDWTECAAYWDTSAAFAPLFEACQTIRVKYRAYAGFSDVVLKDEMLKIGLDAFHRFPPLLVEMIEPVATADPAYSSVKFVYGEYRDQMKVIYGGEQE